jgi:hypothetical protein
MSVRIQLQQRSQQPEELRAGRAGWRRESATNAELDQTEFCVQCERRFQEGVLC